MKRSKQRYRILTFQTTHDALSLERFCRSGGIPGRLIPLPPEISAGCGLAWRMTPGDWDRYAGVLRESGVSVQEIRELMLY